LKISKLGNAIEVYRTDTGSNSFVVTSAGNTSMAGNMIMSNGNRTFSNSAGHMILSSSVGSVVAISGTLKTGTHTAIGAETVTGYIEVQDIDGNTRKLAVVS
jgi:deoxyhypusine synthase